MEKYKFIVKLGQIKDLIAKGQDEKAIELAETVDFKKVKNIEDLGGIAALFLKKGMLLKARECYLELYDRVANRNTVMQLINLALRLKRPGEAEKYLREYQKIDRNDFYGLIFRYNIDKLEGKPVTELIPTLEKLKKKEYIEAWAYELAKLYHKAGEVEKCMAECDDLIVFFGEGEYVERAKALRDYYEKEGAREAREKERAAKEAEEKVRKEELAEENARAVEEAFAKHDAVDPDVTELTSDGSADEGEEAADGAQEEVVEVTDGGEQEMIAEEVEEAVTDGALEEITEVAAENADVATESVAEETVVELTESTQEETTETEASINREEVKEAVAQEAPVEVKKPERELDKDDLLLMQLLREEGIEQPGEIIEEDMVLEDEDEGEPEVISISAEAAAEETEETDAQEAEETQGQVSETEEDDYEDTQEQETETIKETADQVQESVNETESAGEKAQASVTETQDVAETPEAEDRAEEEPGNEKAVTYAFTEEGLTKIPAGSRLAAFLEKNGCSLDDQFGYLAYINDIRVQIIKALELILNTQVINAGIAVTGADRTDMIEIIKGLAKIESKSGLIKEASCALAPADKINRMDLETKVGKLVGRCLVIEGAGALSEASVESILKICDKYGRRLGLILADNRSAMTQLLRDRRELNSILPVRIHVPVIDEADTVNMVKYTIMKGGYSVTGTVEEAILARVKAIKADPAGRYAEARRFINAVIDAADKRATQDYLAATADGRRISGETAIVLEDVESVK